MTEQDVREIVAASWAEQSADNPLVDAQVQIFCKLLVEVVTECRACKHFDTEETEIFYKIVTARSRLSYFFVLQEGKLNQGYKAHLLSIGLVYAAGEFALKYCYEHYEDLPPKFKEVTQKDGLETVAQNLAEIKTEQFVAEARQSQTISIPTLELEAMDQAYSAVIYALMGEKAFLIFKEKVNKAFGYLRLCQLTLTPDQKTNTRKQ